MDTVRRGAVTLKAIRIRTSSAAIIKSHGAERVTTSAPPAGTTRAVLIVDAR